MNINQTPAEIILESIERAFSACLDKESEQRLNEMWEAPEMATARDLTEEAGISWDFESWQQTVELIQGRDGQWARLWEQPLTCLADYAAPPAADRFKPASLAEIKAAIAVLERAEDGNAADDLEIATRARSLHKDGVEILIAKDEDGYYFAARHTVRSLASEAMLDRVHASSINQAVASALFAEIADSRDEADARIAEVLA